MAATSKDHILIEEVKHSAVPVPWCDEFEKMISGMKRVYPQLLKTARIVIYLKANVTRVKFLIRKLSSNA